MKVDRLRVVVDGIVYGFQKHGGINTYFNELLPRLASRSHTAIELLVPSGCYGPMPGHPVHRLRRNLVPEGTGLSWRFDRLIGPLLQSINGFFRNLQVRSRRPCVFHSTYFTFGPSSVPQVATAHDMNHELFPDEYATEWGQWLRRQYPEYLRRATRIIAVSQKTKEDVIRFYGVNPGLVDVVHHAADLETFWPDRDTVRFKQLQVESGLGCPYFLYVGGRHAPYKNFIGVLRAFSQMGQEQRLMLAVAGAPWSETEKAELRRLCLTSRVRLISNPRDAVLRLLYSFADGFVYPSYSEGFGIPLLEAMACGCVVLASDISVFREVGAAAPIYFNPHDPDNIAAAMQLALSEGMRKEHATRGFAQVASYSWDKCAEKTYAVYQRALAAQNRP